MTPEAKLAATAHMLIALRALIGPDSEGGGDADEWEVVNLALSDDEEEGFHVQITMRLVLPSAIGGIL